MGGSGAAKSNLSSRTPHPTKAKKATMEARVGVESSHIFAERRPMRIQLSSSMRLSKRTGKALLWPFSLQYLVTRDIMMPQKRSGSKGSSDGDIVGYL